MERVKLATVWLGGCSGCHMSFLDLDEYLIELAGLVDFVYTPLIDQKEYPAGVDVALVEGAVANEEHREMIERIRERTRFLVSFGDCAITGNVTALRNPLRTALPVLQRAYGDASMGASTPGGPRVIPKLLDQVVPLARVVRVDGFLPGCPPPAPRIRYFLAELLQGRAPQLVGRDLMFG